MVRIFEVSLGPEGSLLGRIAVAAARVAGVHAAIARTITNSSAVPPNEIGSIGGTPTSSVCASVPMPAASAGRSTPPMAPSGRPA